LEICAICVICGCMGGSASLLSAVGLRMGGAGQVVAKAFLRSMLIRRQLTAAAASP